MNIQKLKYSCVQNVIYGSYGNNNINLYLMLVFKIFNFPNYIKIC